MFYLLCEQGFVLFNPDGNAKTSPQISNCNCHFVVVFRTSSVFFLGHLPKKVKVSKALKLVHWWAVGLGRKLFWIWALT